MRFLWFLLVLPLFAEDTLILKDGKPMKFKGDVGVELRMLALQTQRGKVLLSKDLVDWTRTFLVSPDLVYDFEPEVAQSMAESMQSRRDKPPTKIGKAFAITDEDLKNLTPDAGLTDQAWQPDAELRAAQAMGLTGDFTNEKDKEKIAAAKAQLEGKGPAKKGDRKGPIIDTISRGGEVEIEDHLEEERYVIFDFYADWCGPCKQIDPKLRSLVNKHPEKVALKKIDIVNWQSAVAAQYQINSIPHLRLYDDKGKLVMKDNGWKVIQHVKKVARKEKW